MPLNTRERSCGTAVCDAFDYRAQALAVYDKGDDCTRRLRRQRAITGPSIPIQLTDDVTELRDGSEEFPIKLPAMQAFVGEAIPAIVGILPDGTLVAWKAGYFSGRKKLVLDGSTFKLTGDYLSDLFDQPICEADCNEIDGALGYKAVTTSCPGEPSKTVYQVCRIPTCCCAGGAADPECPNCAPLDALLAS